jgi:nicotinamidase-related amidase
MKKALVVVDFQNEYIGDSLGMKSAEKMKNRVIEKIKAYLAENADLFFTLDNGAAFADSSAPKKEGENLGAEEDVSAYFPYAERIFEKGSYGSLELAEFLRVREYDEVEIVGLVSNICVISNAVLAKTALPEARIVVDSSCTASGNNQLHNKALDVMKGMEIEVV